MTHTITKTLIIAATPEQVWGFLTDPDKIARWFHKPKEQFEVGKPYTKVGTTSGEDLVSGTVIKMQPHSELEYTFTIAPLQGAMTNVHWALEPVEAGTCLTLTHSGLPDGLAAFGLLTALDGGWDGHLSDMRTALKD
ncbi:MAG: SRPBCC family protein [Planktomarina sp.]